MKKSVFWALGILFWALSACTPPVGGVQEVEVTFKVTDVPAEYTKVYLAGDFTNWDGGALEMSPVPGESGSFTVKAKIAKESRIHYKYVGSTGAFNWAGAESFPRSINRSSFIVDEGGGKASIVNKWNEQGRADRSAVEVNKIRLEATPPPGVSDQVYVAGVMNGWNHEAMTPEGGKWVKEITLDPPVSVKPDAAIPVDLVEYSPWLEYKYTKGNWDTVEEETPPTGRGDGNRVAYAYKVQGGVLVMEDTIKRFK